MSCGAACARQILLDVGIDVSEAQLRAFVGFDPALGMGMTLESLASALNEHHPGARYRSGSVAPDQLPSLAEVVPFLVVVRTPSRHIVIVQEIKAGEVIIRDPAGVPEGPTVGLEGVMNKQAFIERWRGAGYGVLFRCG